MAAPRVLRRFMQTESSNAQCVMCLLFSAKNAANAEEA